MKKILILFIAIFVLQVSFAQGDKETRTFGFQLNKSYGQIGVSSGVKITDKKGKVTEYGVEGNYSVITLTNSTTKFTGTGWESKLYSKSYFSKEEKGFFIKHAIGYGSVKYDENFYSGKYRYLTLFNPEIGYDFKIKNTSIGLLAGPQWNIEIKGKGDVDNKSFDNWIFRAGIRIAFDRKI